MVAAVEVAEMDEFEELENELNQLTIEELIIEIEEGNSDSSFVLQRQVWSGGPMRKIIGLLFAIPLIPVLGLGIYLIWNIFRTGPINEHTIRIDSKVYSKQMHSIIDYRLLNHKIARSKISPIGNNAFIELTKIWSDNMGGYDFYCYIKSDKKKIKLPYFESGSRFVLGTGIEELFVDERLQEFARFTELKLVSD